MAHSSRGNYPPRGRAQSRGNFQSRGQSRGNFQPRGRFESRGNFQRHGEVGSGGRNATLFERPQDFSGSTIFSPSENPPTPSEIVQCQENENLKAYQEPGLAGLSSVDQTLPLRPGYGTQGRKITLRANYFNLVPDPTLRIYRYSIDIIPDPASGKRRQIISLFLATPTLSSIGSGVATDYSNTIVSAKELDLGGNGYLEESVLYRDELELTSRPNATIYKVKLSPIGLAEVTELLSFLSSPPSQNVSKLESMAETISAMNIAVTQTANASSTIVSGSQNRKFFPLDRGCDNLGGGLIAIRGYYSSVRGSTARILVNVNVCTSAFYPGVILTELIQLFNDSRSRDPLRVFLKGLRVTTNYFKDDNGVAKPRVHTIYGLARLPGTDSPGDAENTQFRDQELSSTSDVSVREFFMRKHGIQLQHPSLPVVNVGSQDHPIYLPPEVCHVVKGQRYLKKLSGDQTAAMITAAVKPPSNNARAIIDEGMKVLGMSSKNPILDAFGLAIEPKMITVPGRILPTPLLVYKNKKQVTQSASWNMANHQFINGSSVSNWSILRLLPSSNHHEKSMVNDIDKRQISVLQTMLRSCGIDPGSNVPLGDFTANLSFDEDQNDRAIQAVLEDISKQPARILLVILPNDNKHTYSRIKFWADVKFGIHTICSVVKKLHPKNERSLTQYFANIGLKINLKMGGTNQLIEEDKLGIVKDGMTMLVGIDVTHPSPASIKGAPSIAGVVASIDKKLAQWPASIRAQQSKKEMVSDLETMMVERLEMWQAKNSNRLPNKILVYRDGVSESQYKAVLNEELPCLQKACEKIYPANAPKPKISIIIVGKRHHTRFFPVKSGEGNKPEADKNGNSVNGTIVDRGVTMQNGWDFFLQAHTALHGTAKPAHYVVIRDEIGLGVDELEKLTHNLCYLYGRATKAVSVCPPAYYADLLCERGRCYLYRSLNSNLGETFDWERAPWLSGVHPKLADSMFYI